MKDENFGLFFATKSFKVSIMAKFLTTKGCSFTIEDIIQSAERRIVLISPYLQFSYDLFERLQQADNKGIKISILYGKTELDDEEFELLARLKHVELRFLYNLHAKIYFNENTLLISSMNLYQFSELNNRETGIALYRTTDEQLFKQAESEAASMWQKSLKKAVRLDSRFDKFMKLPTGKIDDLSYQLNPLYDILSHEFKSIHRIRWDHGDIIIPQYPCEDISTKISHRIDFKIEDVGFWQFINDRHFDEFEQVFKYPRGKVFCNERSINIYPRYSKSKNIGMYTLKETVLKFYSCLKRGEELMRKCEKEYLKRKKIYE